MSHANGDTARSKVVIIDDDEAVRNLCASIVSSVGFEPHTAGDGISGGDLVSEVQPGHVLLDVNLPGPGGMELLREIRLRFPLTRVIMITGYASVERAVEAMKLGAYDYITKPFTAQRLVNVLRPDRAPKKLEDHGTTQAWQFCNIVGVSNAMQQIFELVEKAARSDSTVLVQGESGTGKELVARAIHARSTRSAEPFVPVDCGAIAPSLIESELFGHLAGAFTDARTANDGLLRSAGKGFIFLDEIGELPQAVQVKLLRALQESEVRPVGGTRAERLEARIIAATNRDLGRAVERGTFRRDLFYRLHVIPIFVPPLRDRREDIPLLVEHFMKKSAGAAGREMTISPEALSHLMRYDWPGNVRELENSIQRAFALLDDDVIQLTDMARLFPKQSVPSGPARTHQGHLLAAHEAEAIRQALREANGNKRKAARLLGIGVATLYRKLKKYRLAR